MANPYIRQSSFSDGDTINAALFNDEYDQLVAAFSTSGHTHDGTAGEGAPITKLGPTQDVVVSSSSITPKTNNTVDLGSSSLKFKDAYFSGNVNVDGVVTHSGNMTIGNAATDTLTINATIQGSSLVFEGATPDAHETTLAIPDATSDITITLPNATDTLIGKATTDVLTNKTLTSPVINTGVSGSAILDSDTMSGASATTLSSSESIKAYVDTQVATVPVGDVTSVVAGTGLTGGGTTGDVTVNVIGGTGITANANDIAINFKDEDDMSSNSDVHAATQQSIKAYVDGQITSNATTNEEIQDVAGAMVTGNTETGITVTYQDADGTIDFVVASQTDENFTTADHSKLDGIEANATADQTNAEIRAAVEAATDSNVFTDADHAKLNAIEASADVTDTTNVVAALTAGNGITIASDGTIAAGALALTSVNTAANQTAQLALTTEEGDVVIRSDENKTYIHNGGTAGTMADFTLMATPSDAVTSVAGNTGVVTNAQIAAAVEAASDSNTFTDADHSKLNAIAASANNYVHPNHSGEVTSTADGATVIADNVVDEANLKVSNTPTNGYFLSAQSGNTGGMTWAEVDALPTQSSNSGKFLTTDGSDASWATIATGNTTANGMWEHAHTIASNYSITSGNNAIAAGPITINSGISVTIPTGSTWVIA